MSVRLNRIVETDPRFESWDDERATGDGYWLYCAPGYWNPYLECSFIHEDTVKEVLRQVPLVERDPRQER